MTAPIEGRVPQDGTAARLTAIEEEQRHQRKLLERVLVALTGDVTGARQGVHERLNEHQAQLGDHGERLDALEGDHRTRPRTTLDRLWQVALVAIAALSGAVAGHWK